MNVLLESANYNFWKNSDILEWRFLECITSIMNERLPILVTFSIFLNTP